MIEQSKIQIGKDPDVLIACVGGGSNAMGLFYPFIENKNVRLIGGEAGGLGLSTGKHAAPLNDGKEGILHGMRTYLMQDDAGQVIETHSVSAGLDYPGVGPEHAWLKDIGRAEYVAADDEEALEAFKELTAEQKAKMGEEAVGRYERVSAKIASFEKRLSANQYFALLQDVAEPLMPEE